ncbi:MAG: CdaR family protein [Candidatus Firestonebacteria bacterium]
MPLKRIEAERITQMLKDSFSKNLRYKIIALIIAIAAWAYVSIDENVTVKLDVPLKVEYSDDTGLVAVGDIPKDVTVTLWGPIDTVRALGPSQVKATLDIGTPVKGDMKFELTPRHVYVPADNVKVLKVAPSKIKLNFQKYTEKK